ncbi:MAG: hypothetical protein ACOZE5_08975 [Verrucomicrobiota bacterium]
MNPGKSIFMVGFLAALGLAGCGPSAAERAAQERQRLELEEKSRREAEQANKAITDMNKKVFGKKPAPAAPEPEKKP